MLGGLRQLTVFIPFLRLGPNIKSDLVSDVSKLRTCSFSLYFYQANNNICDSEEGERILNEQHLQFTLFGTVTTSVRVTHSGVTA